VLVQPAAKTQASPRPSHFDRWKRRSEGKCIDEDATMRPTVATATLSPLSHSVWKSPLWLQAFARRFLHQCPALLRVRIHRGADRH
jgi:hypothetical protein